MGAVGFLPVCWGMKEWLRMTSRATEARSRAWIAVIMFSFFSGILHLKPLNEHDRPSIPRSSFPDDLVILSG
jgi:hypothetical protein